MKLKFSALLASALTLLALLWLAGASPVGAQTATPESPVAPVADTMLLTVTGVISNGTAGAATPAAGLEITVYTFDPEDNMGNVTTVTTTLAADGSFIATDIPSQVGWEVAVSAAYQDVFYSSEIATVAEGQTVLTVPLTVYETTAETSHVMVEQMHVFFDFTPGTVSVMELYIISNVGDRAVVNPEGTVLFALPPGATELQLQGETEGLDYVLTQQGFAELRPLTPGSGIAQLLVSFNLPYTGKLDFAQTMLHPVLAAGVLVPEGLVTLTSTVLQDEGLQNMQDTAYRIHGITNMQAGQVLSFQLSGDPANGVPAPAAATASAATTALDPKLVGIGVGVLGVVVVGIGFWFYRRQNADGETEEEAEEVSQDELLQAIADLDDDFETGEVDEPAYKRRRAKLKAQLLELMEDEK